MPVTQLVLRTSLWAINTLFLLVISYFIYQPLRTKRPSINLVLFGFCWVFLTTTFTLLSGLTGILTPEWLGGISVVGLSAVLLIPGGRTRLSDLATELSEIRQDLAGLLESIPAWLRYFTILFIGFNFIRFAFLIWALPPFVWDSLTYHLTNVAHWVQVGRIELFNSPVVRIYTPANYEVLASWFAVFLHHDVVIEAAGLPAYFLAITAIYAGIRGLGSKQSSGLMGSLAYATMPGFLIAVTGTKNDPHMAAYYLIVMALLIHLFNGRGSIQARKQLGPLVVLVLTLLLAAGTKAYIAHLLPGLVLAGLLLLSVNRPRARLKQIFEAVRRDWQTWSAVVRVVILALILVGLFLGGFWNVRNWILKGNPFYPYGVAIEGNQILPEGDRTARFNDFRLRENLRLLSERFWDRQDPIRPDLTNTTGWGWFAYGLGLPTVVWALLRRRSFWGVGLGFFLSFIFLMFSTRPSPWNLRYSIWFTAVFSYSFALFYESIARPKWGKLGVNVLFVGCLSINLISTINYNAVSIEKFQLMLERSVWQRHASVLKLNMPAEYENALVFVPEGEILGYNLSSNGFIYPLYKADFSQELVYVPFDLNESCSEIAQRMELMGTRYLFVAPGHTDDLKILHLRQCGDNQTEIRERARGLYVLREE